MTAAELEEFFNARILPKEAQINRAIRITDVELFVRNGLERIKMQGIDIPSYWHLLKFKDWLLQQEA